MTILKTAARETMLKDARNKTVKSLTLASSTVTLNKFVFLGFDFITHIFSFLFSLLLTYYQVISVLQWNINLVWHD